MAFVDTSKLNSMLFKAIKKNQIRRIFLFLENNLPPNFVFIQMMGKFGCLTTFHQFPDGSNASAFISQFFWFRRKKVLIFVPLFSSTECARDLDKLNLVKLAYGV